MLQLTNTSKQTLKALKCLQRLSSKEKSKTKYLQKWFCLIYLFSKNSYIKSRVFLFTLKSNSGVTLNSTTLLYSNHFAFVLYSVHFGTRYQPKLFNKESSTISSNFSLSVLTSMFLSLLDNYFFH